MNMQTVPPYRVPTSVQRDREKMGFYIQLVNFLKEVAAKVGGELEQDAKRYSYLS